MMHRSRSLLQSCLVVESPSKAKTIQKLLNNEWPRKWSVIASRGHVVALKEVDPLRMIGYWQLDDDKGAVIDRIMSTSKDGVDEIYLATDPDREGEVIAADINKQLEERGVMTAKRVFFNEVTDKAVCDAMRKPGHINKDLVSAGNSRRIADYYFGIGASIKLMRNTSNAARSAGRVQTPALAIVIDREEEIATFKKEAFKNVRVSFDIEGLKTGNIIVNKGTRMKADMAEQIEKALKENTKPFKVKCEYTETQAKPPTYFDTATCLKEVSKATKLPVSDVSACLQKLFEWGHITYHRTDATMISTEAAEEIDRFIVSKYGSDYIAKDKTKAKKLRHAQEAHEAIRPTNIAVEEIDWQGPHCKVYQAIRTSTLKASMAMPQYSNQLVKLESPFLVDGFPLSVTMYRRKLIHDGSLTLGTGNKIDGHLTRLPEDVKVDFTAVMDMETKPPAMYNAAEVIEKMKSLGIGRPSTYGSTMRVLEQRGYVEEVNGVLASTELGRQVLQYMREQFASWVDYGFTAMLEADLDKIATGKLPAQGFLESVRENFSTSLRESRHESKSKILGVHPRLSMNVYVRYRKKMSRVMPNAGLKPGWFVSMGDHFTVSLARCDENVTLEEAIELLEGPGVLLLESKYADEKFFEMGV